ncbi:MAG: phosphatase PAP2 family protein [Ktedonobacteraceae bacterium]
MLGSVLWVLAVIAMVALAFFAHAHRQPMPFELAFSKNVQAMGFPSWVATIFRFLTRASDPSADLIEVPVVLVLFLLFRWFWQALFLGLAVGVGNGVDALIGDVVGRPRPLPRVIHVDSKLIFNSFPSGHSCHMMVFYGFLLYLTFTQPVRQSRYRWLVIPFQIWAIINILVVGFARIWEGEHWITDVIGGYLDGAIWLVLFIFLYNLTLEKVHERRAKKRAFQKMHTHS